MICGSVGGYNGGRSAARAPAEFAMPPRLVVLLAAAVLVIGPGRGAAADRYFVVVFGSQSMPKVPQQTHTFLTGFRVPAGQTAPADVFTISWLPATLVIRDLRLHPEPGVNLTLDQTLQLVTAQRQRVSLWGPYEVPPAVFGQFYRQYLRVAGGNYLYQAVDNINPNPRVVDCIHAVSDADPLFGRGHYPLVRFGTPASHHIVRQFFERNEVIDPAADHGGYLTALGVTAYPVIRREFRDIPGGRAPDWGWRLRPGIPIYRR